MSFFVVSPTHAAAIAHWAHSEGLTQSPVALAKVLRSASRAAYRARYGVDAPPTAASQSHAAPILSLPGFDKANRPDRAAFALALLQSLGCQCAEGGVQESPAGKRIDRLTRAAFALARFGRPTLGVWSI